jgi:glycosyltransferase involved in cell wall biosynthesis
VIPHYNDVVGLENALKSVYSQTRLPEQVIVVDDQSPDVDLILLEGLSSRYGFDLFQQTNQGQSAARNFGVRNSRCSHICFLDQDDIFLENHIEEGMAESHCATWIEESRIVELHIRRSRQYSRLIRVRLEEHPTDEFKSTQYGWIYDYG